MSQLYKAAFYSSRREMTLAAARRILAIVGRLVEVGSAVDLGCGTGTWLSVAKERGATEVLGFEGHWLRDDAVDDPAITIIRQDLEAPVRIERRFDLAISLEVAEHLGPARAESFVEDLCRASDVVLFAAAVPGAGGKGHINEQWQSYWAEKFAARGYVAVDAIRPEIWDDPAIPYWYRQDAILYLAPAAAAKLSASITPVANLKSLDSVHPELYLQVDIKRQLRAAALIPRAAVDYLARKLRARPGA